MVNYIEQVHKNKPLVHHITNYVTVNDCANITLFWGGLPVMAHSKEEVEDMVKIASSLVINIGTLDEAQVESMILAGKKANEKNIPVILDPVGVGATNYRTKIAMKILNEIDVTVISGNKGEITVLSGQKGEVKGVESVGEYEDIILNAKNLATKEDSVVVVSGKEDIVSNGDKIYKIKNGSKMLGEIVGTGCMLTSTIGVFTGANSDCFNSTLYAVSAFGIAGEQAAAKNELNPFKFKIEFMDTINKLNDKHLIKNKVILEI